MAIPKPVARGDRYVFALTYGPRSDWVQDVLAAGRCKIETRQHEVELRDPVRFTDPTRRLVPIPARWILRLIRVDDFIALRSASRRRVHGHGAVSSPPWSGSRS
jgi:hypothetical protein